MIETADPRLTLVPATGFWRITVPMLLQELSTTPVTAPRTRPAACRVWPAPAVVSPLRSGTKVKCYGAGPQECQQGYSAAGKPGTTFGLDSNQKVAFIRIATRE